MIYYVNSLYVYSFFGFVMESMVYKFKYLNMHSGIFYGPITEVYGFGVIALIILKKYLIDKIKCNKYLKVFVTFILCAIILTLIEYIGGSTLNVIFDIDMWDYTKKEFNFGKYICLDLALIWGLFGTLYIYYVKRYVDKFIDLISFKATFLFVVINIVDTFFTLITK